MSLHSLPYLTPMATYPMKHSYLTFHMQFLVLYLFEHSFCVSNWFSPPCLSPTQPRPSNLQQQSKFLYFFLNLISTPRTLDLYLYSTCTLHYMTLWLRVQYICIFVLLSERPICNSIIGSALQLHIRISLTSSASCFHQLTTQLYFQPHFFLISKISKTLKVIFCLNLKFKAQNSIPTTNPQFLQSRLCQTGVLRKANSHYINSYAVKRFFPIQHC